MNTLILSCLNGKVYNNAEYIKTLPGIRTCLFSLPSWKIFLLPVAVWIYLNTALKTLVSWFRRTGTPFKVNRIMDYFMVQFKF